MTRTKLLIAEGVLCSPVANEAVLLELASGRYFGLNEVGARVWALIQDGTDLDTVAARLVEEFEVDADTVRRDLERLVGELVDAGLVRVEHDTPLDGG